MEKVKIIKNFCKWIFFFIIWPPILEIIKPITEGHPETNIGNYKTHNRCLPWNDTQVWLGWKSKSLYFPWYNMCQVFYLRFCATSSILTHAHHMNLSNTLILPPIGRVTNQLRLCYSFGWVGGWWNLPSPYIDSKRIIWAINWLHWNFTMPEFLCASWQGYSSHSGDE